MRQPRNLDFWFPVIAALLPAAEGAVILFTAPAAWSLVGLALIVLSVLFGCGLCCATGATHMKV